MTCLAIQPLALRSRPGRPKSHPGPAERLRRIRAVGLLLLRALPAEAIAAGRRVSRRTLFAWRSAVLDPTLYPEPEADAVRSLCVPRLRSLNSAARR